mgnify:CR=1 FL=1
MGFVALLLNPTYSLSLRNTLLGHSHEKRPAGHAVRAFFLRGKSVLAAFRRHGQQLFLAVPVEGLVVLFGFEAALFKALVQLDFLVGHEVQAVATEEPQQVARHQVGDLRVAVEHLADQVLAQVQAAFRVARQVAEQLVETFEEQGVGVVGNLFGFADPDRMVKLSTGLSVRESSVVKNVVNLASGEVSIQYETEHADGDGRPLAVPRRFLISIPVFKREAAYLVPVKLAYRKKGGALEWTLDLFRSDRFRDDAIDGMRHDLEIKLIPEGGTAPVVPVHLAKRAG